MSDSLLALEVDRARVRLKTPPACPHVVAEDRRIPPADQALVFLYIRLTTRRPQAPAPTEIASRTTVSVVDMTPLAPIAAERARSGLGSQAHDRGDCGSQQK